MADLETLKADALWNEALRLGKLLMHLGYSLESLPGSTSQTLREMATSIPKAVGEAHLADHIQKRQMYLDLARTEARRVETILTEVVNECVVDLAKIAESFVVADALRERLLLAQMEEREVRLCA